MSVPGEHLRKSVPSREPGSLHVMPRPASALGICCTCNYVDSCTGRATWIGPVFHCEEFDDRVEMPRREAPRRSPSEEHQAAPSVVSPASPRGLCMNCRHMETCGFPRQEGGVWHCEEYE